MSDFDERCRKAVERAWHAFGATRTWADFSNRMFQPEKGVLNELFPTREERQRFMETEAYGEIKDLFLSKIQTTGVIDGANPQEPIG